MALVPIVFFFAVLTGKTAIQRPARRARDT
jgi:hypothetical protein